MKSLDNTCEGIHIVIVAGWRSATLLKMNPFTAIFKDCFWLFSRTFRNTSVWALPLMQLSSLTFFDWFEHFSSLLRLCHKQPLKAVLQNRCYGNFRHAIVNYLNSSQNIWKSERASRLQLYYNKSSFTSIFKDFD